MVSSTKNSESIIAVTEPPRQLPQDSVALPSLNVAPVNQPADKHNGIATSIPALDEINTVLTVPENIPDSNKTDIIPSVVKEKPLTCMDIETEDANKESGSWNNY